MTGGVEAGEGLVERHHVAGLGVIGVESDDVGVRRAEDLVDEAGEGALRADLDEHAGAGVVQRAKPGDELHRRRDLPAQDVDHVRHDRRPHRVEPPVDVGDGRYLGRADVEALQYVAQRSGGGGDDLGVERVADRQLHDLVSGLGQLGLGRFDAGGGAADDRLGAAVEVGDDDVVVDRLQGLFDLAERREHRQHQPVVVDVDVGHLAPASADRFQGVGERQRPCRHERSVLTEAVPHHHVGVDAVGLEQPHQCPVDGEYRRLGDLGLHQLLVGLGDGSVVVGIDEDDVGERSTDQRFHDPVGLVEHLADDRFDLAELGEHVHVLRALPGVEHRHLVSVAGAVEHPLVAQQSPRRLVAGVERGDRLGCLGGEVGGVGEVDRHPHRGAEVGLGRRARRGGRTAGGAVAQRAQPGRHRSVVGAADDDEAPQRCLELFRARRGRRRVCGTRCGDGRSSGGSSSRRGARRRRGRRADRERRTLGGEAAGHVLLEHHVEVRAAEPEGAHARGANVAIGVPVPQIGVDPQRR